MGTTRTTITTSTAQQPSGLFTQPAVKTVPAKSNTQNLWAQGNHAAAVICYSFWAAWCLLWAVVWFGAAATTSTSAGTTGCARDRRAAVPAGFNRAVPAPHKAGEGLRHHQTLTPKVDH